MACSKSDQERAKAKTQAEAQKLGRQAKAEARSLKRDVNRAVQPGTIKGDTSEPEGKLKRGSSRAAAGLDHAALITKVKTALATDAGLSTVTNVNVDVSGSVVTLRGTVDSAAQKEQAGQAVSQVSGVSKVVNDLAVRR